MEAQLQPRQRSALSITTTIAQVLIRICGPIALVLGVLFWTGNALTLLPVHMLAGIVLVLRSGSWRSWPLSQVYSADWLHWRSSGA